MSIQEQIDAALYEALAANDSLAALVNMRIYSQQTPAGIAYPFVLFQRVAGGFIHTSPRPAVTVRYQIECVSPSLGTARLGARFIHAALDRQKIPLDGWNNYATRGREWFTPAPETFDGTLIWRRGAIYEIRADEIG